MATKNISSDAADNWLVLPVDTEDSPDFSSQIEVDVAHGSSNFAGTLTLQKRLPSETDADYRDIATFSAPDSQILVAKRAVWQVRIGFKPGAYTSGQARVALT